MALTRQGAVQMIDDASGGGGDPLAGGEDRGGRLGARVGAGPAAGLGELVRDTDAVTGADDEGHGVGFGFPDPGAGGAGGCLPRLAGGGVVHQHVAALVRQRPGRRPGVGGRRDADAVRSPEGDSIGGGALLVLDGEAGAPGQPAQAAPQPGGRCV